MKVANILLKKKANKDSFDVGREGKCENCKYFFRKKAKQKNKDSYNVGREDKCENWKERKNWEKNKDSFDVGREEKCENCNKKMRKKRQGLFRCW